MNLTAVLLYYSINDNWATFEISNIQLDIEAVRTKAIETRWNECEKYLHIIHFPSLCLCPVNLSFKLNCNNSKKASYFIIVTKLMYGSSTE